MLGGGRSAVIDDFRGAPAARRRPRAARPPAGRAGRPRTRATAPRSTLPGVLPLAAASRPIPYARLLETTRATLVAREALRAGAPGRPRRRRLSSVRILILSQYFTPEVGATSTRVHAFAAGLAARGHDVEVVCEVPEPPAGRGPRRRTAGGSVRRQRLDGFRGDVASGCTRGRRRRRRDRLLFYGVLRRDGDRAGVAARRGRTWSSRRRRRCPSALAGGAARPPPSRAVGARRPRPLARGGRGGRRARPTSARCASRSGWSASSIATPPAITAVTEPFVRAHRARAAATREGRSCVPNGTTQFWLDAAELEPDRAALGPAGGRFVWTFAGNIGLAQGLDTAIDAARAARPGVHAAAARRRRRTACARAARARASRPGASSSATRCRRERGRGAPACVRRAARVAVG